MTNWYRSIITIIEENHNLVEGVSETLFHRYGGKIMEFHELPNSAKKAIEYYMTIDGDRPDFADELRFGYVIIPAEVLKKVCWEAPDNEMRDDYPDWDSYHESYWKGTDDTEYANHLKDKWPVILDDREGIQDGWHRFHWYLRNGVKEIPAIWLTSK